MCVCEREREERRVGRHTDARCPPSPQRAALAAAQRAHDDALTRLEDATAALANVTSARDATQGELAAAHAAAAASAGAAATAAADRDAARAEAAAVRSAAAGGETPLPHVLDRHTPWPRSEERDKSDPELAAILRRVAPSGEVLATVAAGAYAAPGGMLATWATCVTRLANVSNALVVALDDGAAAAAADAGLTAWRVDAPIPAAQASAGANHATSALKFGLVARVLALGYAVLLSDVDVVTFRDPFAPGSGLYRDSDLSAMSDGTTPATAYGYDDVDDDPAMGWARYAHSTRVFALNSGLFYARPTRAAVDAMQRVANRAAAEAVWDQALFNEVLLRPSAGPYVATGATVRVLEIEKFMNSKVLFTRVRHGDAATARRHPPTMLHVNYHPDKHPRMLAAVAWYGGEEGALDAFPDGSE